MKTPTIRRHSSGRAFVEHRKHRHYLRDEHGNPVQYGDGKTPSREAVAAHSRWCAANLDSKPQAPIVDLTGTLAVCELVLLYLEHAREYYGEGRTEYANMRAAATPLVQGFGELLVSDFGPSRLAELQQELVDSGKSRSYINDICRRVRTIFKWGVSKEHVDVGIWQALTTVPALRKGKTKAPDHPAKKPVTSLELLAVMGYLSRTVRGMLWLQWYTGVRAESVKLATREQFDTHGGVWKWNLRHKTMATHNLVVPIGPRCQRHLHPFMDRPAESFLFCPREAAGRNNPIYGRHYGVNSYRQAVQRAQERAGIRRWGPHAIRHAVGRRVREELGIEAAQAVLGHATTDATELYTERLFSIAAEFAKRRG